MFVFRILFTWFHQMLPAVISASLHMMKGIVLGYRKLLIVVAWLSRAPGLIRGDAKLSKQGKSTFDSRTQVQIASSENLGILDINEKCQLISHC